MCGIIAVVRRPSRRPAPSSADVLDLLTDAAEALAGPSPDEWAAAAAAAATGLARADVLLRGTPGVRCLLADPALREADPDLDALRDADTPEEYAALARWARRARP